MKVGGGGEREGGGGGGGGREGGGGGGGGGGGEELDSKRATQLAACGSRQLKLKLEKCDVDQSKTDCFSSAELYEF